MLMKSVMILDWLNGLCRNYSGSPCVLIDNTQHDITS